MYQTNEIANLILVGVLTPTLVIGLRSVEARGKNWFIAAYLAVIAAFVFTVVEGFAIPEFAKAAEHVALAAGAVFLAIATREFMLDSRSKDHS